MARTAKTPAAAPSPKPILYLGQHRRGVDHSRVILPAEWRTAGVSEDFMVMVWPVTTRDCLLVLPPSRWEVIQRKLEEVSITDDDAARVERLISANTVLRSLDSYGRLPLPEEAAQALGIKDEALLVGRLNKFEIWNPDRFAASISNPDPQLIANALKAIRI